MGISPATIFGGAESVPRQGITPHGNNAGRTPSVKPNVQIPGQWRAGDRVSLTPDTESASEDDGNIASTILILAIVIVIVFGLILLLKFKLLWWLGKTIIKIAAKGGSKQMSKNRQTI